MDSAKRTTCTKPERIKDIEDALEDVQVAAPGDWQNGKGPEGWYAVSTGDDGIVAYFVDEAEAFSFRLRIIDRWLNG